MTGLAPQRTAQLLNAVGEYPVDNGEPVPGHRIAIAGDVLCEVVQAEHPDAHMNIAAPLYGPDLRELRLVWADRDGRRPWAVGFSAEISRQPVLGVRATTLRLVVRTIERWMSPLSAAGPTG